ncbi:hypothetical protein EOI86_06320 [Hwanghaeella grinnelliae]|uniref:Methyl-accepting chemotaxis protein n=1 Tax=Hwanghaeella grinnelliae TaxID=2500179 RepID=A0A437QWH5_9PROT|nr:methyl-accepting chemotaxis protein [Hwanghaeella grinnelliae]RVU38877.1 hypothetical protein EOI86_06320 [Hwanghaeella grinnelliae]
MSDDQKSGGISPELQRIRSLASKCFIAYLWVLVLVTAGVAYIADGAVLESTGLAFVFALFTTGLYIRSRDASATRYAIAASLTAMWALIVLDASGLPDGFVLDAHMLFFVLNAQLVAYFCWRTILIVNVIATVHHVLFSLLFPLLIWPSADYALYHFLIHATYVVLVGGPMLWLAWRLFNLFNASHNALVDLKAAEREAAQLASREEERKKSLEEEKRRSLMSMADNLESTMQSSVKNMSDVMGQLEASAGVMSSKADATNEKTNSVASISKQTSQNVETVAAATEELNASSNEIGRQVENTNSISQKAAEEAGRANSVIQILDGAAGKIGEVVSIIQDIAEQTNLLALNATIEAARAGEAGKGFSVVASEVKNLANETAKATDEVSNQIKAIQTETKNAVHAIEGITNTINEVHVASSAIAAAIEEQNAAIEEISRNVRETSRGTQDITGHITEVSENADQTMMSARDVASSTTKLNDAIQSMEETLSSYLADLRTRTA